MNNSAVTFFKEVIKPFKFHLIVFAFVSLLWAVDLSLRPYIIKLLIDQVNRMAAGQSTIVSIIKPGVWYILVSLMMLGASSFYESVWGKFIANFRKNIGIQFIDHLLNKPYSFYHDQFAGALVSKLNSCIEIIPRLIRMVNEDFIRHALAIIISAYTVWQVSPYFAISLMIWVLLYVFVCILLAPKLKELTIKISKASSKTQGHISDMIFNIVNVKLFCKEAHEHKFVETNLDTWASALKKRNRILVTLYVAQLGTFILLQALCLYWLSVGLAKGAVTSSDFALIFMINISVNNCLFGLSRTIADFSEYIGTLTHSLQIIEPSKPSTLAPTNSLQVSAGKITFEHVYFNHKNAPPLFENLCLTIEPGQKVGLVGHSGGGKSTFINLILRLYDCNKGCILIDDQDIYEVSRYSLRDHIALIPQDPFLFHRTLKENIKYARPEASYEEVVQASKQAHAHEFIERLPKQYDTLVGERGVKLSGGQRQRIAIARGLLKNAPILILDEATSQLDSVTETYIQEALWDILAGKTTMVIAHRLSTLLHMDRILVFNQGKIMEDGSHKELLSKRGIYKSLWDAQVGGFLPTR